MSWLAGVRTRSLVLDQAVSPAHLWVPDRLGSHGAEATQLASDACRRSRLQAPFEGSRAAATSSLG
jgi:hypothetical protein